MSISSLLTPSNDTPIMSSPEAVSRKPRAPVKSEPVEYHESELVFATENSLKSPMQRQFIATQMGRPMDFESREHNDFATSSGTGTFGKKQNPSFKDFKYHDSMKVVEDVDKSDTDHDDDAFAAEKELYLRKTQKRHEHFLGVEKSTRKVFFIVPSSL